MMKSSFAKYDDEELLNLLKGRKSEAEAAFTEIYNRYASNIHAYCKAMVKNREQAEDCFQDTFLNFYKNFRPEHESPNISSYLLKIARNLCLNYLRDKPRMVELSEIQELSQESFTYEKQELNEMIMTALDLLDEKYKETFILREIDGLPYKEIAEITGATESNAKTRVARARERLLEILEPYLKEV